MKFAETAADFLPIEAIRDMSGIDYLHRMIAGEIPMMMLAKTCNYRVSTAQKGRVTVTGTPLHDHTNAFGGVHGGWYGAILDTCLTCAVISGLPRGQFQTTLEYKVNMVRAIPVGTQIIGTGWIEHLGKSTGVARGEIRGADDDCLYAVGTATCLVMGQPA